jgi:AmiR/NasT family two-component response regulator
MKAEPPEETADERVQAVRDLTEKILAENAEAPADLLAVACINLCTALIRGVRECGQQEAYEQLLAMIERMKISDLTGQVLGEAAQA